MHEDTAKDLRHSAHASRETAHYAKLASEATNNPSSCKKWQRWSERFTQNANQLMAKRRDHRRTAGVSGMTEQVYSVNKDKAYSQKEEADAEKMAKFAKESGSL